MQEKKSEIGKIIIGRLKKAFNLKTDTELANMLELSYSTLATWKTADKIDILRIYDKISELNINWLLSGNGNMYIDEKPETKNEPMIKEPQMEYKAKINDDNEIIIRIEPIIIKIKNDV